MAESDVVQIEPEDRIVVLARTLQVRDTGTEVALKNSAMNWVRFRDSCLGQALYRHRSVFRSASEAPVWSHQELTYFRDVVPVDVIDELVIKPQLPEIQLLRAEILLTTPLSFILPRNWQGSADLPERQASLEYIDVHSQYLLEYRDVMRNYCGPAAAKLVRSGRFGTFRSMETAAILYQDPSLKIAWNQIHLCELDAGDFHGFGREFEAALREDSPDADVDTSDVFAGLDRIRMIPMWKFNDPVVEADTAITKLGTRS